MKETKNSLQKSESLPDTLKKNISRKKFFLYAGASAASVYALTKLPFELFKSKVEQETKKATAVKFKESPLAVKRTINSKSNG